MESRTFISYAQNFEDLYIFRCFGHESTGHIVDVGAHDPVYDNVTYAFYLRGWKCLNIEPLERMYQKLLTSRPNDVNINIAIGTQQKNVDLFDIGNAGGISTTRRDILDRHISKGVISYPSEVTTKTVMQMPLTKVLEDIAFPKNFEVLKIDVEGDERDVLMSLDFNQFSPKLIIVEATIPLTQISSHSEWEGILLNADYRYLYFDGSNRYYCKKQSYDELRPRFELPPSAFDNFFRIKGAELDEVQGELKRYVNLVKNDIEIADYKHQLETILKSKSWRITAPLRKLKLVYLKKLHFFFRNYNNKS